MNAEYDTDASGECDAADELATDPELVNLTEEITLRLEAGDASISTFTFSSTLVGPTRFATFCPSCTTWSSWDDRPCVKTPKRSPRRLALDFKAST